MASKQEMRKLVQLAREQGWLVTTTGTGHYVFTPPGTHQKLYTAKTPSDARAWKNARAALRRAGLKT